MPYLITKSENRGETGLPIGDLEECCINKLSFSPLFYGRYVDDIFTIIPNDKIDEMLYVFNAYDDRLKFTHETESNETLNFLELKLIRNNNRIITDWYHKETYSGRLLNYKSNHPISQKRAMVFSLVDKVFLLSDKAFHTKNIQFIESILESNDYPKKFINSNIHKRIHEKHKNSNNNNNQTASNRINKNMRFLGLPYFKRSFESVSKKLKSFNIRTIPLITNTFSQFIKRGKDKTDIKNQNNVVYCINCKDCNASYVGETKRCLCTRVKEHFSNTKKDVSNVINSHITSFGHTFDFDKPKILDKEPVWHRRILSEMIHINLQKNAINKKEDSQNLQLVYKPLLEEIKHKQ